MVATVEPASTYKTGDEGLLLRAYENFIAAKEWQGAEDDRSRDDRKFAIGDARNTYQWPDALYRARTGGGQELPCLTINITRVHNDLIINAISKNAYGIKIRPTGGKASYKSAEIMQNIVRRIEYVSNASTQYRLVTEHQVDGGAGYILLDTAYVSERSFDQDIFLRAAQDPTGVYLYPWCKEPDCSDARWGFVFEKMSRKLFDRKYPKYKNRVAVSPLQNTMTEWISDKEIVVAKYYEKENKPDLLIAFRENDGADYVEKLASEIKKDAKKEIYDALMQQIKDGTLDGRYREVTRDEVKWYLIAGNQVVDRGDWAGKYIPIVPCFGRVAVVDGTLDRKGMTRQLIDPNRMLNYNASVAVQVAALAPKSQWMAPAAATEGQEQWKTANTENHAVLLWNHLDEDGNPIPPPERIDPPQVSPANLQGMQDAERQAMMVSGQFQAQMGENDQQSAASGKAIAERQQQGDTATYHFVEHNSDMKRYIGKQLIDLIPKIYDTERVMFIMDEKGERQWIRIDPNQDDVIQELKHEKEDEEAVKLAFNPSIGEYECISDPGPSYATQRQEAWNAYSMILQQNNWAASVAADLLVKFGDFPGAEELRERLQKEIKATKPYLFDEDPNPQLLAANEQLKRLTAINAELVQKLAVKELALKGKDEKRDIEAFKAETDRLRMAVEALAKLALTPQQQAQMEHDIATRSHDATMQMIVDTNAAELQPQATGAEA
jgi:hypothetical protein